MANVFVNRSPVGTLTREDPANRFVYDAEVPASQAVSLLEDSMDIEPSRLDRVVAFLAGLKGQKL